MEGQSTTTHATHLDFTKMRNLGSPCTLGSFAYAIPTCSAVTATADSVYVPKARVVLALEKAVLTELEGDVDGVRVALGS